jgi:hypothetical protein
VYWALTDLEQQQIRDEEKREACKLVHFGECGIE